MLKDGAKKTYQREYMRKKRSNKKRSEGLTKEDNVRPSEDNVRPSDVRPARMLDPNRGIPTKKPTLMENQ